MGSIYHQFVKKEKKERRKVLQFDMLINYKCDSQTATLMIISQFTLIQRVQMNNSI